jgi:hypothetical protein
MRKKPRYFVKLYRDNQFFAEMELEYHWDRGWNFTYQGLKLVSGGDRPIKYRDMVFEAVNRNIQNYWNEQLVEKLTNIPMKPPHDKENTHLTDDEIWFSVGRDPWSTYSKRGGIDSGDLKTGKIKIPSWVYPEGVGSASGCPLHCYMALKKFTHTPEMRKRLKTHTAAVRFGV